MTAVLVTLTAAGCGGTKAGSVSQQASETQAETEAKQAEDVKAEAETPADAAADGVAEAADGQNADSQEETQPEAEGQAGVDSTAETAQSAEESRVPREVRNILVGEWQDLTSQRAGMEISEWDEAEGKDFHAQIYWSNSYADRMVWDMNLEFDPATGDLNYKGGRKAEVTYSEDGMIANEDVKWEDAEGSFSMADVGELRWKDSKQEDAGEFVFVRVYSYDVPAEEFSTNLFKTLIGLETGTAGSSLKAAQAAQEILSFATSRSIWNIDAYSRSDAITEAWNGLSDEDKALFKLNFDEVTGLVDKVFKDYEAVRGTFEDAGVGDDMKALSVNVYAKRSWNALRDLVKELQ